VVRPDWYVYGTARNGRELAALLEQLAGSLQRQPVQAAAWRWPRRDRDGRPISIDRDVPAFPARRGSHGGTFCCTALCPLLAQSRQVEPSPVCPLSGVKRTSARAIAITIYEYTP